MLLDEEHLKDAIQTAVANPTTEKLLHHFISMSGCFSLGIAKDDRTECYNRGYQDFGMQIRDLLIQYAPKSYFKFIEEGEERNE